MPNIFKHFLRPQVNEYTFPQADDILIEPDAEPEDNPAEEEQVPESSQEDSTAPETEASGSAGQGAAEMLSYAKIQADAITAQAKRQGEALVEEYRQKALQEVQQIEENARREGFNQGYADGLVKAQAESRGQLEAELEKQAVQVKEFLQQATEAREALLSQVQDELCDLSIAVAEKVIHVSLKSSREVILRMVQMATERLKRREWVRIYIGGCDSRELAQITPELTASLAGLSDHIKLIPMADDESGTCIIEMPDEIIDASASTQLDNLKGILHGG
ncbi:FliH/SctL family protein [uncultured Pseudoflavonifractor sp.]|uniref:FliH/SctL family protein n=1 Tax=uncultured Pseudoflavonifractor sp. TaxID=1221379 RepID=UPI0025F62E95|nr:FliH/SctL family protein [uncultured Pseudoflavonifractor sp.]